MEDTKLGALDVLFLVIQGCFIAMKLMDKLDWSWWWVLSPIWGLFAFAIVAGVLIGGGAGAAKSGGHIMAFIRRRKRLKKLYDEPADTKPPEWTQPPAENRWWE